MLTEYRYAPDLVAVRQVRDDMTAMLASLGLADQRANDLLLAISEAFTNIVRHGTPAPFYINLRVSTQVSTLQFVLEDDGGYFDGFHSAIANAADPSMSPLAEGGMGLGLIVQLVGGIDYQRVGEINRLTFSEPVEATRRPGLVLVDDDPVIRALARSYLQDSYAIRDFDDAEHALQAIASDPPDLIISDIGMPKMDGLELRAHLQRDHTTAMIPFIFLTGLQEDSVEERASALEIDDFLEKPITKKRLVNAAERVLRRSRKLREALQSSVDRRITDSLRSPLPSRAGPWSIGLLDQAASPGGGDMVIHRQGQGWTSLILLDVMGHGVPAKIFAFAYAGYVQSLLADDRLAQNPDKLIGALSCRVADDGRFDETIVTCVAVCLGDDGTAVLAVGGHPRPLLHRYGQPWRPVPVTGPLPGIGGPPPSTKTVSIEAGDALLLVSDGLGETLSLEHPETALIASLNSTGPADETLLQHLATATDGAADDRTAVLLRFTGTIQP